MLTRCPACSTSFRVQPEQLKARQGKVRCGECQEVFNALDSLIEEFPFKPPAVGDMLASANNSPAVADAPDAADAAGEADATTEQAVANNDAVDAGAVAQGLTSSQVADEPLPDLPDAQEDSVSEPVAVVLESESAGTGDSAVSEVGLATDVPPLVADAGDSVGEVLMPELAAPPLDSLQSVSESEMGQMPVEQPSRSGWGNWLWASGIIVAIATLIVQGVMHFRVEIATLAPELRPVFVTACELVACKLELPRKIEQLSIESSDLHPDPSFPDRPGRLGVQLSLRNHAPFAQTWPHLELTLTDSSDQVIARRVFTAKDYLMAQSPSDATIEQGIRARQDLAVELALDVGELVASGYRLYLFYP